MKRAPGKISAASRSAGGASRGFGAGGFGGFSTGSDGGSTLSYLAEPPSFASISDPNVIVSFKNVLKKDSTTKAKALEDLLAYVQSHPHDQDGGVEEAVLEVWIGMFPRLSIDNSRRVRELSHNLQFELMKSVRKRMERHIPSIVAAWLAGLYDRDRVVARAANDGLSSFLNTPEKIAGFWRKCQAQILDYSIEAIQETQDTLSDERSTTKEDAEAKYSRVVNASLSLVLGLLQQTEDADIEKLKPRYEDYFGEENVWKSITLNDAAVRKAVCHLLFVCLDRKLPFADPAKVKPAIVTGGLKTNQSGSALEYVRALTKLSHSSPDIWSSSNEKKSPVTRLQAFIAKGSQGSPPRFWEHLDQLLLAIPTASLDLEGSSSLLKSLKSGVTHREEPRTNTSFAWKCYIDTAKRLLANLSADDQLVFAQEHLFPLIEQFLFSTSEKPTAIPLGANAMAIFVEAYVAILQGEAALVTASSEEWDRLAMIFITKISSSLPEVSKEFQASQEKTAEEGRRWFGLVGLIHQKLAEPSLSIPDQTASPSGKILDQCISLLSNRNYKPYGAASTLEYALSTSPHLFVEQSGDQLVKFLESAQGDILKVVQSPSSRYIFSCMRLLGTFQNREQAYGQLWSSWTSAVLALPSGTERDLALTSLVSNDKGSELCRGNAELQDAIFERAMAAVHSGEETWELFEAAITYQSLHDDLYARLGKELVALCESLSSESTRALQALEILVKGKPALFSNDRDLSTTLLARLLSLSEIGSNTVKEQAATISSLLEGQGEGKLPAVTIIQSNLERANTLSLDIDTVVQQALASNAPKEEIFPSTNSWMEDLGDFIEHKVEPSLSITSNLGGAVALIKSGGSTQSHQRDRKGRSISVRMAMYLLRLLDNGMDLSGLPEQFQVELLYALCITAQLASDQITSLASEGLWKSLGRTEAVTEAETLVSSTRSFLSTQLVSISKGQAYENVIPLLIDFMVEASGSLTEGTLTARNLYTARALSEVIQFLVEAQGLTSSSEAKLLKTEILKSKPETVLTAAATVVGLGQAAHPLKPISNLTNRLVSDVAAAPIDAWSTHSALTLLTLCGQVYDQGELPVASNRIVFAVRQIVSWLEEPDSLTPALNAEICRALTQLLPCMKELYGPYWEKTLEFCLELFDKAEAYPLEEGLPFIHAALRLTTTLSSLQEPSDDLVDSLKSFKEDKATALLDLLKLPREMSSQPLEIVDGMLCREIEKLPLRQIPEAAEIFPLIASESRDIQMAAFGLLHRTIPAQQEQRSIDVLLDKTDAHLPDELVSLLLDAPTLEKYPDEVLAQFPTTIRCYLLAWKLVFDAYSTSSYKIRNDFTEHLKSEGCMVPLLEFMFDVLGHSASHALKLEKAGLGAEQIKEYDVKLADAELEEKNMHWLLVHLYYLTLKYIPGLFRSWYIDCRSKQTRIAVEAWTTKYFSPIIVEDTLDEVQVWADGQEPPAMDENELLVKVSRPAREVTAGYEVDEAHATIVIKVPSSYPIDGVTVAGLNRVAVTERKWQSWIMTTQGVITFSGGNIIDGLQVFKRNIVGALKGQGECAICYSIISADKRMPDKRCTTCKNLFHRTCLYKWFQTSSQNTCPLCRNPIDYLGADTAKRRQG